MPRKLPIDGDVALTVAARLLMLGCSLAGSIITARLLGPAGRGEYFVAIICAATVVQFGNLGLQSSNLYDLSRDRSLLRGLLVNSLWVSFLLGGGLALVVVGWMQWDSSATGQSVRAVWLCAALSTSSLFVLLAGSLLVALGKLAHLNTLQALGGLLHVSLLCVVGVVGGSMLWCLCAAVASSAVVAALMLLVLHRQSPGSWRFQPRLFRRGLRYAGKAYIVCLLGFLMLRANVFLLQSLGGAAQAGCYSIAAQVADVLWILPASVSLVLFPKLVSAGDASWQHVRRQLWQVAAIMAPACLLAALALRPMIELIFGAAFVPATAVFYWMTPGVFFYALVNVISQYHAARGMPKVMIYIWMLTLVALVAVGLRLIPEYGGIGAAIALSTASVLNFALQWGLAMHANRKSASVNPPGRAQSVVPRMHVPISTAAARH